MSFGLNSTSSKVISWCRQKNLWWTSMRIGLVSPTRPRCKYSPHLCGIVSTYQMSSGSPDLEPGRSPPQPTLLTWTKLGRVCWGLSTHSKRSARCKATTTASNLWTTVINHPWAKPNLSWRIKWGLNTHHMKMVFSGHLTSHQSSLLKWLSDQFTSQLSHNSSPRVWQTMPSCEPNSILKTHSNTHLHHIGLPCTQKCTAFRKISKSLSLWLTTNRNPYLS